MQEVRCKKCHKLLGRTDGELEKDVTLNSASCSPDRIIYVTKCPRCKEETAIVFKKMNTKKESVEDGKETGVKQAKAKKGR